MSGVVRALLAPHCAGHRTDLVRKEIMDSCRIFALLALSSLPFMAGCRESASAAEPQKEPGVACLTQDQIHTAQIELAPAAQHPVDEVVSTTGRVTFDDQRVAHIY